MSAVKQRSGQRTSCWARCEHARQGTSHSPLFCCSTFQAIWKLRSATLGGSRSGADNMDAMSDTSFHTHSLGSKSTSSSGFLPGLGGCIVPFHPVRAVTVAKRREYIACNVRPHQTTGTQAFSLRPPSSLGTEEEPLSLVSKWPLPRPRMRTLQVLLAIHRTLHPERPMIRGTNSKSWHRRTAS